jgi:sec-independent protein translocase protein TatB
MLGIGWTEMLVIGVVALIVIGPRELPAMMQRFGKVVGSVRRMGAEFQREINRSVALDQVTDLRKSITEPLKKTTAEIAREFNKIGPSGTVQPSGAIKPATPGAQSVVAEIQAKAGMTPASDVVPAAPAKTGTTGAPAMTPVAAAAPASVAKTGPVKAAQVSKRAAKPKVETAAVSVPETPRPTPRKRTARVKPIESPAPPEAMPPATPAPKPKVAAKPRAAAKAAAPVKTGATKPSAARKPAARKSARAGDEEV